MCKAVFCVCVCVFGLYSLDYFELPVKIWFCHIKLKRDRNWEKTCDQWRFTDGKSIDLENLPTLLSINLLKGISKTTPGASVGNSYRKQHWKKTYNFSFFFRWRGMEQTYVMSFLLAWKMCLRSVWNPGNLLAASEQMLLLLCNFEVGRHWSRATYCARSEPCDA